MRVQRSPLGRTALRHCVCLLISSAALLCVQPVFPPPAARADLRVQAGAPHGPLWRRVYAGLPAAWKAERDVYVREVPRDEMDRLVAEEDNQQDQGVLGPGSVVDGFYDEEDDGDVAGTITLRASLDGPKAALVFAHEYGHYVWQDKLTRRDRADYTAIWRRERAAHRLVTLYAADSPDEGFAEAFAYFIHSPDRLRARDALSYRFLQELLYPAGSRSARRE